MSTIELTDEQSAALSLSFFKAQDQLVDPIIDMYKGHINMLKKIQEIKKRFRRRNKIISKNFRIINRLPKKLRGKICR